MRNAREPQAMGYSMPAEWEPHAACWMAWPTRPETWPDLDAARSAYARVARLIAAHEPVSMVCAPNDAAAATALCGPAAQIVPIPIDDSWARDSGPTFLRDPDHRIAGISWKWNAWGGLYDAFDRDAALADRILADLDIPAFSAPLVLEGGSIHVDGQGTLLTTEECLLNPNRNPGLSREDLTATLGRFLGTTATIWLGGGLEDDETDGHVDNVACFAAPGIVLALVSGDPNDGNHGPLSDNLARLHTAKDASGKPLTVIPIQQPERRDHRLHGTRLPLSYINFYIANGAVIVPVFDDPADTPALEAIAKAFPDRRVVPAPGVEIAHGGGGIHCITQQQPLAGSSTFRPFGAV